MLVFKYYVIEKLCHASELSNLVVAASLHSHLKPLLHILYLLLLCCVLHLLSCPLPHAVAEGLVETLGGVYFLALATPGRIQILAVFEPFRWLVEPVCFAHKFALYLLDALVGQHEQLLARMGCRRHAVIVGDGHRDTAAG